MLVIDGLLGAFDQRKHVAHAEDAGNNTLGVEGFERVVFLADSHKLHRRPGHFADREGRAATRIAIELG